MGQIEVEQIDKLEYIYEVTALMAKRPKLLLNQTRFDITVIIGVENDEVHVCRSIIEVYDLLNRDITKSINKWYKCPIDSLPK